MLKLYYIAPPEEAFQDLKNQVIKILKNKEAELASIENVRDNFMYLFGMLDIDNQKIACQKISKETIAELYIRSTEYFESNLKDYSPLNN